jgi:prepilin peptidase CpaA
VLWPQSVSSVAVALLVSAAAAWDLRSHRVPNVLTLGGAAAAIVVTGLLQGWPGVLLSAAGWAVGALLFFPLFALGGMGAGDV